MNVELCVGVADCQGTGEAAESRSVIERAEDVFALPLLPHQKTVWLQTELAGPRCLSAARDLALEGTVLLFLFCILNSIGISYLHTCRCACVTSWSPKWKGNSVKGRRKYLHVGAAFRETEQKPTVVGSSYLGLACSLALRANCVHAFTYF